MRAFTAVGPPSATGLLTTSARVTTFAVLTESRRKGIRPGTAAAEALALSRASLFRAPSRFSAGSGCPGCPPSGKALPQTVYVHCAVAFWCSPVRIDRMTTSPDNLAKPRNTLVAGERSGWRSRCISGSPRVCTIGVFLIPAQCQPGTAWQLLGNLWKPEHASRCQFVPVGPHLQHGLFGLLPQRFDLGRTEHHHVATTSPASEGELLSRGNPVSSAPKPCRCNVCNVCRFSAVTAQTRVNIGLHACNVCNGCFCRCPARYASKNPSSARVRPLGLSLRFGASRCKTWSQFGYSWSPG